MSVTRVPAAIVLLAFGWGLSCTRAPQAGTLSSERPAEPPRALSSANVGVSVPALLVEGGPSEENAAPLPFAELVRNQRWEDAWGSLEALPEGSKTRPEIRLVRARVAFHRTEPATALALLDGLESVLPLLTEDIERWRADARFLVGPYPEAAQYLAKQSGCKAQTRAALAFEKAGLADEARRAADRAVAAGKADRDEATARALRLRLAEGAGQREIAIDDARWIAARLPQMSEAKEAEAALTRLDPTHPLTGRERLHRAEKLSEAGRLEDALAELDQASAVAPAPAPAPDEILLARASILYRSRGRYAAAAVLFDRVAEKSGPRQAEAAFYAARARSRADRDDEAQRGYRAVAQKFPKTSWADEASYLAARLPYLHGRWLDAVSGYRAYLKAFPGGKERASASYEKAVALLAAEYKTAGSELSALASAADGPGEIARLRELQGVAALQQGDRAAATSLWNDTVRLAPLSWGALVARTRLVELGGSPASPAIPPSDGKSADAISAKLPDAAELYHRVGLDAEAESYLRAREREVEKQTPGREKEGLCALYGKLGTAARSYRIGIDAVGASLLARAPSPATKWAWDCVYPRPYAPIVAEISLREGLPSGLVYAVMRQESAFDPNAVSGARAVGLLQIMPETARRVASEAAEAYDETLLSSPPVNLDLGSRYLSKVLKSFDGSVPLAVAAYNAGPQAVARWVERSRGMPIDIWAALIPYEETRNYVVRVLSNFARYAYLEGGDDALPNVDLPLPRPTRLAKDAY